MRKNFKFASMGLHALPSSHVPKDPVVEEDAPSESAAVSESPDAAAEENKALLQQAFFQRYSAGCGVYLADLTHDGPDDLVVMKKALPCDTANTSYLTVFEGLSREETLLDGKVCIELPAEWEGQYQIKPGVSQDSDITTAQICVGLPGTNPDDWAMLFGVIAYHQGKLEKKQRSGCVLKNAATSLYIEKAGTAPIFRPECSRSNPLLFCEFPIHIFGIDFPYVQKADHY